MIAVEWLQPVGLSIGASILLIVVSALASFLTAATGLGGGMVLFAAMASFMPLATLIPVHGVVQIGSNASRMFIMLKEVRWQVFLTFAFGSLIGIAIAAMVIFELPEALLQACLAGFILWSAWCKPPAFAANRTVITVTGFVSSFLTMFFGATGVFVAATLKTLRLERLGHLATHAACMVAQHGIKVIAFGLLGFAYLPYIPLILLMMASGVIGTLIGRHIVIKMNDKYFHLVLSWVLTLLALRLIWGSLTSV